MLLSLSGNRRMGADQGGSLSLGIKDQISKLPLSFAMIAREGYEGQLIQPSRNIPKAFESWPIWKMVAISTATGEVSSRELPCIDASTLKLAPLFYSSTVGTAQLLITGTTWGGTEFPMDFLDINVTSGSFEVGTGIMIDGGPGGLVEQKGYLMRPLNVSISGLVSIRLSVKVITGILDINIGVC